MKNRTFWWTDAALDAAIEAQRVRLLSFSGVVVHPDVHKDMLRWAMADAIAAAQKKQTDTTENRNGADCPKCGWFRTDPTRICGACRVSEIATQAKLDD